MTFAGISCWKGNCNLIPQFINNQWNEDKFILFAKLSWKSLEFEKLQKIEYFSWIFDALLESELEMSQAGIFIMPESLTSSALATSARHWKVACTVRRSRLAKFVFIIFSLPPTMPFTIHITTLREVFDSIDGQRSKKALRAQCKQQNWWTKKVSLYVP